MSTGATTNNFTNNVFELLDSDLSSNNRYYIAFGSNDLWVGDPPNAVGSIRNSHLVRQRLHSYKRSTLASFVVPRVNYDNSGSTSYNAYDDNDPSLTNFYVLTDNDEVFVCIQKPDPNSSQLSTIKPTTAAQALVHPYNPARSYKTSDGYVWRFLYKLSNLAKEKFLTTNYMPVKVITSSNPTITEEIQQKALQDSAVSGEIINFVVTGSGTGNTLGNGNPLTVNGGGFGSGADFFAFGNSGGELIKIHIDSDGSGLIKHGSGYRSAVVSPDNPGASFTARSVFGPVDGLNSNPLLSLNADNLMITAEVQDEEGSADLSIGSRFHQVALIKNPKDSDDSFITLDAANALRKLTVSSLSGITVNGTITGQTSDATALVVDTVSGPPNYVYYVQRDSDGLKPFQIGESLGSQTVTAEGPGAVNPFTGELLFYDNVATVVRQSSQTEDLKIIINLSKCT